jgi:hypothetical protein
VIVADAFAANDLYQDNGWTDGLPIVPPTDALVRTFLEAARMENRAAAMSPQGTSKMPGKSASATGAVRLGRWSRRHTRAPDFFARLRHMDSPITPSPMNPRTFASVIG